MYLNCTLLTVTAELLPPLHVKGRCLGCEGTWPGTGDGPGECSAAPCGQARLPVGPFWRLSTEEPPPGSMVHSQV